MANKEIREITQQLAAQGWRIEEPKRGGHAKAFSPDDTRSSSCPAPPAAAAGSRTSSPSSAEEDSTPMPEWTANIESPADTTRDEDALVAFAEALERDPRALGPAASLNTATGQVAATFQVIADERDEAAMHACLAYWYALGLAGLNADDLSSVTIAPAEDTDDATPFDAHVKLEVSLKQAAA